MSRAKELWAATAALTLASFAAPAAANNLLEHLQCNCTSTHFADVSFSIQCSRNSTSRQEKPIYADGSNTFIEDSSVTCSRVVSPAPGPDYRRVENVGYYKFHPRMATWEDALRTCASEGANLALPNSQEEAAAMAAIFEEFPKLHEEDWLNDQAWIGATDLKTEGVFLSLGGITLEQEGWEQWEKGEPNNEGDGEHCAVFNRDKELTDEDCGIHFAFFCERPL